MTDQQTQNIIPKLIIVEGPDNVGKDYVIELINKVLQEYYNKTTNWFNSIYNMHCLKPSYGKLETKSDKIDYTTDMYKTIIEQAVNMLLYTDAIIMNRSYLSEFVYGKLYRGMTDAERNNQLNTINQYILSYIYTNNTSMPFYFYRKDNIEFERAIYDNILYLQLDAPTHWLLEHEDGKSQSENDPVKIEQERSEFDVLFNREFPFRKEKMKTVVSAGTEHWKSDEQLIKELKDILHIEQ